MCSVCARHADTVLPNIARCQLPQLPTAFVGEMQHQTRRSMVRVGILFDLRHCDTQRLVDAGRCAAFGLECSNCSWLQIFWWSQQWRWKYPFPEVNSKNYFKMLLLFISAACALLLFFPTIGCSCTRHVMDHSWLQPSDMTGLYFENPAQKLTVERVPQLAMGTQQEFIVDILLYRLYPYYIHVIT